MRLLALAALLPMAAACGSARADVAPLTAEQTASLNRALFILTNGLSAPSSEQAPAYTLTEAGDHYALSLALPHDAGEPGVTRDGSYSAAVRMLDGGRWAFDDLRGPFPYTVNVNRDQNGKRLGVAAIAQGQTGHAIIDPSLTTTSTSNQTIQSWTITFIGSGTTTTCHLGRTSIHDTWTPVAGSADPGRIDRAGEMEAHDLTATGSGKIKFGMTMGSMRLQGNFPDISLDQVRSVITGMSPFQPLPGAAGGDAAHARPAFTLQQGRQLRALAALLRATAGGFDASLTINDSAVSTDTGKVTIQQMEFGEGKSFANGTTALYVRLGMRGLAGTQIPDTAQALIPRRITLTPRISGLPTQVLLDTLDRLSDGATLTPQQIDALRHDLFAKGPISAALDDVDVELGASTLTGSGVLRATALRPAALAGSATLTLTGYDALLQRVLHGPGSKTLSPVLIFLKGIGRQRPDGAVVWDIVYADQKILVNGTDLSAVLPRRAGPPR